MNAATPSAWKSRFPIFRSHPELVYLDSASTCQRVDSALTTMEDYFLNKNANVHRNVYPLAEAATQAYEGGREVLRRFIHAKETAELIFTRGTTESINLVAQSWGQRLHAGDEILLSVMEHHSNLVPWQLLAERTGAQLRFCPLTAEGTLDEIAFEQALNPRVKLVGLTGMSNVLGTLTPLKTCIQKAHAVGALVLVDAAQMAAHLPLDVQDLDCDFLAFSSHKIYGPTGAGLLYGKRAHLENMPPWMGGGDMIRSVDFDHSTWNDLPWKFEAGTPAIAEVLGFAAAAHFLMDLGFDAIAQHEELLHQTLFEHFEALPFVEILGSREFSVHRGVYSLVVNDVHPHDVAALLGEEGICIRAGHHCAMPLMKTLNLVATNRLSFGVYTTPADIEKAAQGFKNVAHRFGL